MYYFNALAENQAMAESVVSSPNSDRNPPGSIRPLIWMDL